MLQKIIALVLSCFMEVIPMFTQSFDALKTDIQTQIDRVEQLEYDYYNGNIDPIDENSIFDGDLQSELANGLKFNELSCLATHNSYQTKSVPALRTIYQNVSKLSLGWLPEETGLFEAETLTDQLNAGIRSFELDIEVKKDGDAISFVCMHAPLVEMNTTSYNFALAMKEINLWSKNNPNHLPITIIIEPKLKYVPMIGMKFINLGYLNTFDTVLRESLGDTLVTPADMLGDYESFAEMRAADDWKEVKDLLGKVMVILHPSDDLTDEYINQDATIKSQAMFPMLDIDDADEPYASFIKINDPEKAYKNSKEIIKEKKLIVRTRADEFTDYNKKDVRYAMKSGAQIVTTDYPVKSNPTGSRVVCFGDNKTARSNVKR